MDDVFYLHMNGRERNPLATFKAGFGTGVGILAIELCIFLFDILSKAFKNAFAALPSTTTTYTPSVDFSMYITLFVGLSILQNLIIGILTPEEFVWGFLLGDGLILCVAGYALWPVVPSVVIGMLFAFLIVLGCYLVRKHLEKPKYPQW
jgi:hypothetical protein